MWLIEPRFFRAEYSGLIAAPGTPNAQTTPSLSRIRTAASIARIFAILYSPLIFFSSRGDLRGKRRAITMGLNLFPALWHCAGFPTLVQSISGKKKWNWRMRFEL